MRITKEIDFDKEFKSFLKEQPPSKEDLSKAIALLHDKTLHKSVIKAEKGDKEAKRRVIDKVNKGFGFNKNKTGITSLDI